MRKVFTEDEIRQGKLIDGLLPPLGMYPVEWSMDYWIHDAHALGITDQLSNDFTGRLSTTIDQVCKEQEKRDYEDSCIL